MTSLQGLSRGHLYIVGWICGSFALFNLASSFSIEAVLMPLLGPFCIVGGEGWQNGFSDYSLKVTLSAVAILALGFLLQVLVRPQWLGQGVKYAVWIVCWFFWCFSGYLSMLGQLG